MKDCNDVYLDGSVLRRNVVMYPSDRVSNGTLAVVRVIEGGSFKWHRRGGVDP